MHERIAPIRRFVAVVNRSQSELNTSSQCIVTVDSQLMATAGLAVGDIVSVETPLGRETLARIGPSIDADTGSRAIRRHTTAGRPTACAQYWNCKRSQNAPIPQDAECRGTAC